jgi:hypothetical protein
MKISELISELAEEINLHGDIEVKIYCDTETNEGKAITANIMTTVLHPDPKYLLFIDDKSFYEVFR